jgi:hypothetical protein
MDNLNDLRTTPATTTARATEADGIDQLSPEVADMAQMWSLYDALTGGTLTMRAAGKKFLPQLPSEGDQSYKDRLSKAVLFNAFNRTAEVLSAKPLSRPIEIDGVSETIKSYFGNIDGLGSDLHCFAGSIMRSCMRHGLHGVLVDHAPSNAKTIAEEKMAGTRPYARHYACGSILGWQVEHTAAGAFLVQLRLKEMVHEKISRFVTRETPQIRILQPGKWETWRKQKTANGRLDWVLHDSGISTVLEVPFVFFYGYRQDFGIGRSPLRDIAHLNVLHWQSSSDQQHILSTARSPILFSKGGFKGGGIVAGPEAVNIGKADSDLYYVEHTGAAIEAGRQSIFDIEDQMRMLGAELLAERTGMVTARQVIAETEDNRSILQRITEEAEDGWESVLRLMGLWLGEKSSPKVEMFKDFGSLPNEFTSGESK